MIASEEQSVEIGGDLEASEDVVVGVSGTAFMLISASCVGAAGFFTVASVVRTAMPALIVEAPESWMERLKRGCACVEVALPADQTP